MSIGWLNIVGLYFNFFLSTLHEVDTSNLRYIHSYEHKMTFPGVLCQGDQVSSEQVLCEGPQR